MASGAAIFAFSAISYLSIAALGVRFLTAGQRSHVLELDRPSHRGVAGGSLAISVVAALLLALGASAGSLLFLELGRATVPGMSCTPSILPTVRCWIEDGAAPQHFSRAVGLLAFSAFGVLFARAWLRDRPWYPLAQAALVLTGLAALIDIAAGSQSARSTVLFGAITGLQTTCTAGILIATLLARPATPAALARIAAVGALVVAMNVCGAIALAHAWTWLPAASAVAVLMICYCLPALAGCAVMVAVPFAQASGTCLKADRTRPGISSGSREAPAAPGGVGDGLAGSSRHHWTSR